MQNRFTYVGFSAIIKVFKKEFKLFFTTKEREKEKERERESSENKKFMTGNQLISIRDMNTVDIGWGDSSLGGVLTAQE